MNSAVCPGSFDPPTLGHLDIFARVAVLFEEVTIAVLVNPDKTGLFSVAERMDLLREVTGALPNVTVDSFSGLLVQYCQQRQISTIVKGLRGAADFDYELSMAQMNRSLTGVDTLFIPTAPETSFISSSLVKQIAGAGGDISRYLSIPVADALAVKLSRPSATS